VDGLSKPSKEVLVVMMLVMMTMTSDFGFDFSIIGTLRNTNICQFRIEIVVMCNFGRFLFASTAKPKL
jgi:hypothetical protein